MRASVHTLSDTMVERTSWEFYDPKLDYTRSRRIVSRAITMEFQPNEVFGHTFYAQITSFMGIIIVLYNIGPVLSIFWKIAS